MVELDLDNLDLIINALDFRAKYLKTKACTSLVDRRIDQETHDVLREEAKTNETLASYIGLRRAMLNKRISERSTS
jgi:hypothetical protein